MNRVTDQTPHQPGEGGEVMGEPSFEQIDRGARALFQREYPEPFWPDYGALDEAMKNKYRHTARAVLVAALTRDVATNPEREG